MARNRFSEMCTTNICVHIALPLTQRMGTTNETQQGSEAAGQENSSGAAGQPLMYFVVREEEEAVAGLPQTV